MATRNERRPFGRIPSETLADLRLQAQITDAVVIEARHVIEGLATAGIILRGKEQANLAASVARQFWKAKATSGTRDIGIETAFQAPGAVRWDTGLQGYVRAAVPVDPAIVKAASDAVAREAQARILVVSQQLQAGRVTLLEWYRTMKRETLLLHAAEGSLPRGGWEQMLPKHWRDVADIVTDQWAGVPGQFPGLRRFARDIMRGRYGPEATAGNFLDRASMYADAGRLTYENTRLQVKAEQGHREAKGYGRRLTTALIARRGRSWAGYRLRKCSGSIPSGGRVVGRVVTVPSSRGAVKGWHFDLFGLWRGHYPDHQYERRWAGLRHDRTFVRVGALLRNRRRLAMGARLGAVQFVQ